MDKGNDMSADCWNQSCNKVIPEVMSQLGPNRQLVAANSITLEYDGNRQNFHCDIHVKFMLTQLTGQQIFPLFLSLLFFNITVYMVTELTLKFKLRLN